MTAEDLCLIVKDLIGLSYPSDKDKLFFLCTMANHEIWKNGKWDNMMKVFDVNTRIDSNGNKYIVTPNDYSVLLGVNLDYKPTKITNSWFKFHRNGDGTDKKNYNMTGSVMDLGKSPVIEQPRYRSTIQLGMADPVYITARSRGVESDTANLIVSGENRLGQTVYSFKGDESSQLVRTLENPFEADRITAQPTYGVDFKLTNKFSLCDNIHWTKITSISKTVTNNPVDVYAVHDNGMSYLIATLAPHQRQSNYRIYQLPKEECKKYDCIQGLFKVTEPEKIEFGSQQMVTDNITALVDMIIGMDYKFNKRDLNNGAAYILSGRKALEDVTRESMANTQVSVQFDTTIYGTPEHYLSDNY